MPAIIDVEASGFGGESYPIEVGIALSNGERFCTLIKPAKHWTHWDDSAEAVHHISKKLLHDKGRSIIEVAKLLNQQFQNQTLFSDGWVVDKPWMIRLFHTANIPMLFSISPLEMILKEDQMNIWQETKNDVIRDLSLARHRASNDALIIQETFKRTSEQMIKLHA